MTLLGKAVLLSISLALVGPALAQPRLFAGKWRAATNRDTDTPAVAVSIIEKDSALDGIITLANPDRTQHELPILNPIVNDNTLKFQTDDRGAIFDWRLTLSQKNPRRGLLTGSDRRHGKFGSSNGEMLVRFTLQKTR